MKREQEQRAGSLYRGVRFKHGVTRNQPRVKQQGAPRRSTLALKAVHSTTTQSEHPDPPSAAYSRVQPERAPVPRHRALQDRDQRHILVRPWGALRARHFQPLIPSCICYTVSLLIRARDDDKRINRTQDGQSGFGWLVWHFIWKAFHHTMDNTAKMTFLTLLFRYRSAVHQIIAVYTNIKYREITKLIPGKRFRDSTGIEDWTRPTIPNEQNSYTRGRRHTAVELELSTKKWKERKKEKRRDGLAFF